MVPSLLVKIGYNSSYWQKKEKEDNVENVENDECLP